MGKEDGIFITYTYNGREIEGIEQFQQELEDSYPCQGKSIWIPACAAGGEFWITIFLSTTISAFLLEIGKDLLKDIFKDSIVAAGKRFFLEPFRKALSNLRKRNEEAWGLKILTSTFSFNDVEVVIGGLSDEELSGLGTIFKQIHDSKQVLTKEHGEVIRIEIPAHFSYGSRTWELNYWRSDEESLDGSLWIITYWDEGKALYNSKTGKLLDYYSYVPDDADLLM